MGFPKNQTISFVRAMHFAVCTFHGKIGCVERSFICSSVIVPSPCKPFFACFAFFSLKWKQQRRQHRHLIDGCCLELPRSLHNRRRQPSPVTYCHLQKQICKGGKRGWHLDFWPMVETSLFSGDSSHFYIFLIVPKRKDSSHKYESQTLKNKTILFWEKTF